MINWGAIPRMGEPTAEGGGSEYYVLMCFDLRDICPFFLKKKKKKKLFVCEIFVYIVKLAE
jgi:hypothetical protein